jgi:hypothetical protein
VPVYGVDETVWGAVIDEKRRGSLINLNQARFDMTTAQKQWVGKQQQ